MKEGIVGGEAFAVDASIIVADAHRRRGVARIEDLVPTSNRAVSEYLSLLDDAAFGGATSVEPKTISPTDPAARYTASPNSVAGYAYSDNDLIDLKHAVIMGGRRGDDDRSSGWRSARPKANARLPHGGTVRSRSVAPGRRCELRHGGRRDGRVAGGRARNRAAREPDGQVRARGRNLLPRANFAFDPEGNLYACPAGKELKKYHRSFPKPRDGLTKDGTMIYFRAPAGLPRLPAEAPVLPERSCTQDRALRS